MRIDNEETKRNDLKDLLIELSKDQSILSDGKRKSDYFIRLEGIYHNSDIDAEKFRHYYTDIFAVLTLIDGDQSIGNLDILAQNIQAIKDGYQPLNKDESGVYIDISKEIIKLYDHTNLEIGRINYTKRMNGETLSELSTARGLLDDVQVRLKKSDEERKKEISDLEKREKDLSQEVKDGQKRVCK